MHRETKYEISNQMNTLLKLTFIAFLTLAIYDHISAQESPAPPGQELIKIDPNSHKHIVGSRPGRKGGFRLEAVEIEDRTIVHNYGHGGYGVTLSPGTSMEAIQMVLDKLDKKQAVIVIGAGVIGLTTAYLLAKKGYFVEIYSKKYFPNIVSGVAAAMWNPYPIVSEDEARSQMLWKVQNESIIWYQGLLNNPEWGVREVKMFVPTNSAEPSEVPLYQPFVQTPVEWLSRLPIKGFKVGGYAVSTFFIDTYIYMPMLMKELKELGVKFITRELTSLNEFALEAPKGAVIFNATGLGSRWLVPDEKVYPIRGDLCIFEGESISSKEGNDYLLSWGQERADYMFTRVSTANRPGQFIFGGVYEENDASTDPKDKYCKRTLESYLQFLKISKN